MEGWQNAQTSCVQSKRRQTQLRLQLDGRACLLNLFSVIPVDQDHFRKFPEVSNRRISTKGLSKGKGKPSVDVTPLVDNRTELTNPHHGMIHFLMVTLDII